MRLIGLLASDIAKLEMATKMFCEKDVVQFMFKKEVKRWNSTQYRTSKFFYHNYNDY